MTKAHHNTNNGETRSALLVAEWRIDSHGNNRQLYVEELYWTPRGQWYLYGKDGGLSTWEAKDRKTEGGIRSITEEEALIWCKHRNISAEIIAKHFPRRSTVEFPSKLHAVKQVLKRNSLTV